MSAWWSRVGADVEKHDGRSPKLGALIRLNFAVNAGAAVLSDCGLYRRDPAKHPDEPDVFAAMVAKVQRDTARAISKPRGGRR